MITEVRIVRYLCESGSGEALLKVEVVRRTPRIEREPVGGEDDGRGQRFRFVQDGYIDQTTTVWQGKRDQEDALIAFDFWGRRLGTTA